jgi:pimeloyl-ACP methyl ester carboxylesterase
MNEVIGVPGKAISPARGIPMWALGVVALTIEFTLWLWLLALPVVQHRGVAAGILCLVLGPLLLRLLIAFASYVVSRVKGIEIPAELRLGPISWCRFFMAEYLQLCVQNLLLIPFRTLFRTAAERGDTQGGGRVLLLQHGYLNNGGVWFPTTKALSAMGYRVFTSDQPAFASIDAMGAKLAARIDEVLAATGAGRLTLVAHSMGGLVCRAYLRSFGGDKVEALVTMGSPHHGTFHAFVANGENGHQMRPGNAWLRELSEAVVPVPFTSIYSVHDTVISPQDSSVMPGANNVRISAIGHVSMPGGARARDVLVRELGRLHAREAS